MTRFSLFGRTHAGRSRSLRLDSSGLLAKVEVQSGAGKKPFRTGRVRAVSGGRVSRSLNALAHSLGPVAAGPARVGPVPTESGFR